VSVGSGAEGRGAAVNRAHRTSPGLRAMGTTGMGTTAMGTTAMGGHEMDQPESPPQAREETDDAELSSAVAALTEDDVEPTGRAWLLARVVREEIRQRGGRVLLRPKEAVRWMVDAVSTVAPHIPIRDLDTLREH